MYVTTYMCYVYKHWVKHKKCDFSIMVDQIGPKFGRQVKGT